MNISNEFQDDDSFQANSSVDSKNRVSISGVDDFSRLDGDEPPTLELKIKRKSNAKGGSMGKESKHKKAKSAAS